ncbi:MAG: hypothetical protein ACXWQ5_00190 [Ktedonobacterales bacterium]
MFSDFSRAGIAIPKLPDRSVYDQPMLHRAHHEEPLARWKGIIVARTWDSAFDEAEYRLMLAGGNRAKALDPGCVGPDGCYHLVLTDAEAREAKRLLDRHCLDGVEYRNVACSVGRTALLNYLATTTATSQTGVQYFAVGNGASVTPAAGDTSLGAEVFRKLLSSTTISGNSIDLSSVFLTTDTASNTTYTEAGIFGVSATGTANSGTLFAHASYNYTKSSSVNLTNDYYIYLN